MHNERSKVGKGSLIFSIHSSPPMICLGGCGKIQALLFSPAAFTNWLNNTCLQQFNDGLDDCFSGTPLQRDQHISCPSSDLSRDLRCFGAPVFRPLTYWWTRLRNPGASPSRFNPSHFSPSCIKHATPAGQILSSQP